MDLNYNEVVFQGRLHKSQRICFKVSHFILRIITASTSPDGGVEPPHQLICCSPNFKIILSFFYLKVNKMSAPWVGIEPTTNRLTGDRSTAELPRNLYKNFLTERISYY